MQYPIPICRCGKTFRIGDLDTYQERMRCCRCYMGRGTVCPICEENDE